MKNLAVIHLRILRALEAAAPYALPEPTLFEAVNCDLRPPLDDDAFKARMSFLADRAMVRVMKEDLDPTARKWVITEAGKASLASLPSA